MRVSTRILIGGVVGLAACALLVPAAPLLAGDDYPVVMNVYVSGAESGGFMTPEVSESVKDVRKALDGKKVLQVVDSPQSADLIVIVLGRDLPETGRRIYRSRHTRRSYRSTSSKEVYKAVRARLQAGSYQLRVSGYDNLWWGTAAKNLATRVEKWVKGNYGQMMARRDKREASFSSANADAEDEEGGEEAEPSSSGSGSGEAQIEPGMTEKQVLAQLGAPTKKVAFGPKSQWVYKNMTIVFEKGKVTDVKF